jgi:sugar phosphate permease
LNSAEQPTGVRHRVIGVTTLAAVFLYLDRVCIAEIAKLDEFKTSLGLTDQHKGAILASFFFAYALAQTPAGWLSDRFGARRMLPFYILAWSACTFATGLAGGFVAFIVARSLFGVAQAGCYPTAGSLIKRWIAPTGRGKASSFVSVGGRIGGALAPVLTAWLLADLFGWRAVLMLYGALGVAVAALFWWHFRESPAEHPRCNDAERALVRADGDASADGAAGAPPFPPIVPLLKSGAMWLMCLLQFGINFGWAFLVSWLPTYLKEIKGVEPKTGGIMSTIILACGIVGMLLGGPVADLCARTLGRRRGRSFPLVACYTVGVLAYLSCLRLESAWAFVAAACIIAFVVDMSVPTIWAYMQDVGGKNTAAVFGWGNMWGNFGAGVTILLVPVVLKEWDANGDWHEAFLLFSVGFLVAGLAALGINADRKIE